MTETPNYLETLSKKDLIETIQTLQKQHQIPPQQIKHLVKEQKIIQLPSYIFTKKLSALESIVKYLKEEKKLSNHEIGQLLNRNDRTIWTTYRNAQQKNKEALQTKKILFTIPLNLFKERTLSILETLVKYLKEQYEMNYHDIGQALERNERTIWTVYQRGKKKQ